MRTQAVGCRHLPVSDALILAVIARVNLRADELNQGWYARSLSFLMSRKHKRTVQRSQSNSGPGRVGSVPHALPFYAGSTAAARAVLIALCSLVACSCVSERPAPISTPKPLDDDVLPSALAQFSRRVSRVLNDRSAYPPPNNSYTYETADGPERLAEPPINLAPTETYSALAATDCSGWMGFAVDVISPLHSAVLQSQRKLPDYNQSFDDGFALNEASRAWSRAFVLADFLRTNYASATGFIEIDDYRALRPGDVGAYAMGRYANPDDEQLLRTPDTGHAFIITGRPSLVEPNTPNYDGQGTLSSDTAQVIAVAVIDSSALPHFPPDSRMNSEGKYVLPASPPYENAHAGGIGSGTLWFSLDAKGQVLQRRFGPSGHFDDVVGAAGRMVPRISLRDEILDTNGNLVVANFSNAPSHFAGVTYGRDPVQLTGPGGLHFVGESRVVLSGLGTFAGGVTVGSADVVVDAPKALGSGDVWVRGGTLTLRHASVPDDAILKLSSSLAEGSVRLDFDGTDRVREVHIGTTVYTNGTCGAPGSGATHTHPIFVGQGMLAITGN